MNDKKSRNRSFGIFFRISIPLFSREKEDQYLFKDLGLRQAAVGGFMSPVEIVLLSKSKFGFNFQLYSMVYYDNKNRDFYSVPQYLSGY